MSILVVGSLHLDVVLRAPHLPALDETVAGTSVEYVFGGKGGNQAIAAARMGGDVRFAGRAGSDPFGDMLRETLKYNDIDLDLLQLDEGPSGMSSATVDANGEYGAVIVSAANLHIDPDQIEVSPNVSLVLLQNEIPTEVNVRIADMAKRIGAQVWLNAAPARHCPQELLALIDVLIVNRAEAQWYTDAPTSAAWLNTLGPDGVMFDGDVFEAFKVNTCSTHGAGDMFIGALAARVDNGASIKEAIPFAQAAAALHVSMSNSERSALGPARVNAFIAAHDKR
ncbi:ribokinase [Tateyamaria omphalii]|uniref:PfkB family carbohydrate kinase n=1 Tax=Tateyamaria omphalii TaxID=299262 RepID=UPI001674503E|nr:PfkB family carbohydrate kinase [Tateyamaria omphalii]GGX59214.1 ribokinase [Tateyamaria omphalii]